MKNSLLVCMLLTLLSTNIYSQEPKKYYDKYGRSIPPPDNSPAPNTIIYYDGTNIIKEKGNILNGLKEGEWITYYEIDNNYTPKIKMKGKYVNDLQNGEWIYYDREQRVIGTINYKNGVLDGAYSLINYLNIKEQGNYKDGKKDGVWIKSNDLYKEIIGKTNYKNGEIVDNAKLVNGSLMSIPSDDKINQFNSEGKPDGLWIMYNQDAEHSIKSKGSYVNGIKDGEWIEYSNGSSISYLVTYKMGIKNGIEKEYYTAIDYGCLWRETSFKSGLKNGQRITYYPLEGCPLRVKSKENFVNDIEDGQQIDYYLNGRISEIRNYKQGKKDGEFIHYNDDGQIDSKAIWSNGVKTYSTEF